MEILRIKRRRDEYPLETVEFAEEKKRRPNTSIEEARRELESVSVSLNHDRTDSSFSGLTTTKDRANNFLLPSKTKGLGLFTLNELAKDILLVGRSVGPHIDEEEIPSTDPFQLPSTANFSTPTKSTQSTHSETIISSEKTDQITNDVNIHFTSTTIGLGPVTRKRHTTEEQEHQNYGLTAEESKLNNSKIQVSTRHPTEFGNIKRRIVYRRIASLPATKLSPTAAKPTSTSTSKISSVENKSRRADGKLVENPFTSFKSMQYDQQHTEYISKHLKMTNVSSNNTKSTTHITNTTNPFGSSDVSSVAMTFFDVIPSKTIPKIRKKMMQNMRTAAYSKHQQNALKVAKVPVEKRIDLVDDYTLEFLNHKREIHMKQESKSGTGQHEEQYENAASQIELDLRRIQKEKEQFDDKYKFDKNIPVADALQSLFTSTSTVQDKSIKADIDTAQDDTKTGEEEEDDDDGDVFDLYQQIYVNEHGQEVNENGELIEDIYVSLFPNTNIAAENDDDDDDVDDDDNTMNARMDFGRNNKQTIISKPAPVQLVSKVEAAAYDEGWDEAMAYFLSPSPDDENDFDPYNNEDENLDAVECDYPDTESDEDTHDDYNNDYGDYHGLYNHNYRTNTRSNRPRGLSSDDDDDDDDNMMDEDDAEADDSDNDADTGFGGANDDRIYDRNMKKIAKSYTLSDSASDEEAAYGDDANDEYDDFGIKKSIRKKQSLFKNMVQQAYGIQAGGLNPEIQQYRPKVVERYIHDNDDSDEGFNHDFGSSDEDDCYGGSNAFQTFSRGSKVHKGHLISGKIAQDDVNMMNDDEQ